MNELSVPEAAKQLGLSEQRVRAMAQAGQLSARKVGYRWLISLDEGERKSTAGRPLSAANAWALLALLSGESPTWVHPSVRSRLKQRLRDVDWLQTAFAHSKPRARIHTWRVLPGDLNKLQVQFPLVYTGHSIEDSDLDVFPSGRQIDAYIDEKSLGALERRYRPEHAAANPNLILRVPSHSWILKQEAGAPQPVIAADLLQSHDPRAARAARRLLAQLAND